MRQPILHGFTLLRNGLKYDYPFRESLAGLGSLCESVVVAAGQSEDGTEEALKAVRVITVPTVWNEAKRQGGVILSEQTNIALEALRRRAPLGWGFYLQADEAISERDFDLIRADLLKAEQQGCDAISFRYLHFWQSFEAIAVGRRWYPQEIRCVRLDSKIESYGDAQSFRGWTRKFESEATIYHYGHVREANAYEKKKKDFHRWWHPDTEIAQVIAKGDKCDRAEDTLRYLGPHPSFMKERIKAHGGLSESSRKTLKAYGREKDFSAAFLGSVQAKLEWTEDERLILKENPEHVVLLRDLSPLSRLFSLGKFRSRVGSRMGSPHAREWTPEFRALLRLSEKGVRVS